jgi:2-phosphosulfolactate phosphatase
MSLSLEVSLSPALYPYRITTGEHITVVIDVLRFTTSLISAFDNKVMAVIPVSSPEEAEKLKNQGYPVAAERDGLRLPFADYGNSASDFKTPEIKGETLVYSTTNGTVALKLASENGPVISAAFTNLPAVAEWLMKQGKNIVILCSGWKNLVSIEDTLCAGALIEILADHKIFSTRCDTVALVSEYWKSAKNNPAGHIMNASHYKRLLGLGVDPMLPFSLMIGSSESLPVFRDGLITDFRKIQ